MNACPYCQIEVDDGDNFCGNCEQQVKCLSCAAWLRPQKTRCLKCGMPLVGLGSAQTTMNEYSLEEKQTTKSAYRRVSVRATDQAIGNIVPLFGIPTSPIRVMTTQPLMPQSHFESRPALQDPAEAQEIIYPSLPIEDIQEHNHHVVENTAHQYFEIDGEHVVARISDFKGKSRKAQQERYILLYVWAYQQILDKALPLPNPIYESAKTKKLYDRNMSEYFKSVASQFLSKGESGYRISREGDKEIDRIIGEIEQGSSTGFAYWDGASKPMRKRASLSAEDQKRIKGWVARSTEADQFDVRKLKSSAHYAMFTLWFLTKNLKVDAVVKPIVAFAYLSQKFTQASTNSKAFGSALRRLYNKKWFAKNPEGLYCLTPEAEQEVERWMSGGAITDIVEPAEDTDQDSASEDQEEEE